MSRFLKLILSEETKFLALKHPKAFLLLFFIAERARRENGHPDGLIIGDAFISSTDLEPGMSRQNFRTALNKLVEFGHVEIVANGKKFIKRQKSTIKVTIKGILVNLLKSTIYDINPENANHCSNQRLTNDQPTTNHKQEGRRMNKNEKENHPSIPSFGKSEIARNAEGEKEGGGRIDDFSSSLEEKQEEIEIISGVFLTPQALERCIKLKGDVEKVKHAIEFIQNSEKRKFPIDNWPHALEKWKIENKFHQTIKENISYSEKLCKEFSEFYQGRSWRCSTYTDREKDQRGLLFESVTSYEPFFVSLSDGEFRRKCEEFIAAKNMRKTNE